MWGCWNVRPLFSEPFGSPLHQAVAVGEGKACYLDCCSLAASLRMKSPQRKRSPGRFGKRSCSTPPPLMPALDPTFLETTSHIS